MSKEWRVIKVLHEFKDRKALKHLRKSWPFFMIFLAGCVANGTPTPQPVFATDTPKPQLTSPAQVPLERLTPSATPLPPNTDIALFEDLSETITPSPELKSEFAAKPGFEIDFSTLPEGKLPPDMFNIEVGTQVASYNNEQQFYTDRVENIRIEADGNGSKVLIIQARKEQFGEGKNEREYTSGRIDTKGIFDFLYGKVVITAKLPKGVGTWPALWGLSTEQWNTQDATAEDWEKDPFLYILDGEIDFMEHQGAEQGTVHVNAHTHETLTQGTYANQGSIEVPDVSETFHEYGFEWTPDEIRFTLDGEVFHTVPTISEDPAVDPFNQPYHLILNLAMGGTWAETLAEEQDLDYPNAIDDSSKEGWRLIIKRIAYFPLSEVNTP